jgi:hypothetical protein
MFFLCPVDREQLIREGWGNCQTKKIYGYEGNRTKKIYGYEGNRSVRR